AAWVCWSWARLRSRYPATTVPAAGASHRIPSWMPSATTLSKNCRLLSASGERDNILAQDGGRSSGWRASTLIADHFEKRPDGRRAALGFHLAVDSALAVCLAFGV